MPIISFSEDDLLRGKIVEPAWYSLLIKATSESLSKDGDSTNYLVETTILKNADNGSEDFAGVPIELRFNSKAKSFSVGFFNALGVDVKPNARYEFDAAVGKTIDAFIETDTWQGRLKNQVNHKYRTPRS